MDKRKAILDSKYAIYQYKYFYTISTIILSYTSHLSDQNQWPLFSGNRYHECNTFFDDYVEWLQILKKDNWPRYGQFKSPKRFLEVLVRNIFPRKTFFLLNKNLIITYPKNMVPKKVCLLVIRYIYAIYT